MDKMDQAKIDLEAWFDRMFGSKSHTAEMRRNAQVAFSSMVERFDLVSRKEFKAQQKTLAQAIKKMAVLEKKLAAVRKPAAKKVTKKPVAKKK